MKHWIVLLALASPVWADEAEWRPPFITTPPEVVERMLQLAGTRAGDLVVDLGIEFDAALVEKSRENAKRMKLEERVRFVEGDVLRADISGASVVTVYLLPALMVQLQSRFLDHLAPGTRIVSHSFTMAGWPPDRSEMVKLSARHPGQGDESRLYLWIVPADVRGLWRGGGLTLRIEQNFQQIDVEGATKARISGRDIAWERGGVEFKGRVEGDRIIGPFELVRRR
jgi:hypothetical protein